MELLIGGDGQAQSLDPLADYKRETDAIAAKNRAAYAAVKAATVDNIKNPPHGVDVIKEITKFGRASGRFVLTAPLAVRQAAFSATGVVMEKTVEIGGQKLGPFIKEFSRK